MEHALASTELRAVAEAPAIATEPAPGPFRATEFTENELATLNQQFEAADAEEIVAWAAHHFGPHLALAASMTRKWCRA